MTSTTVEVVLKNTEEDPDNFFGVILNAEYGTDDAAMADLSYTYTVERASAGSAASSGSADADNIITPVVPAVSGEPAYRYQFYDVSITRPAEFSDDLI